MDEVVIVPYSSCYPAWFAASREELEKSLGALALRIDHIGSTSVPGLAAKPILDIQVSVDSLEPVSSFLESLEPLGYQYISDNPDLTKRFFLRTGEYTTHLHIRKIGTWHQQFPLLFRDYLQQHPQTCRVYEQEKYRLAAIYRNNRLAYMEAKNPVFWHIQFLADRWASQTGWEADA